MKSKISRLVFIPFFMALVLLPQISWAEPTELEVKVDGLSCPFCAYGMEKQLKKVEGMEELKILVDEGRAILKLREGAPVDVSEIKDTIKKQGFTPREATLSLSGTVVEVQGRPVLKTDGLADGFILEGGKVEQLKAVGQDKRLRVTGEVNEEHINGHGAHLPVLRVEKYEME